MSDDCVELFDLFRGLAHRAYAAFRKRGSAIARLTAAMRSVRVLRSAILMQLLNRIRSRSCGLASGDAFSNSGCRWSIYPPLVVRARASQLEYKRVKLNLFCMWPRAVAFGVFVALPLEATKRRPMPNSSTGLNMNRQDHIQRVDVNRLVGESTRGGRM